VKPTFLATLAGIGAVAAIVTPAQAEVRFNGFGQIVAGSSLGNDHPFPGSSYDSSVNFKPDSLFALQVQAPLTDKLSATAQIVATGANDDFTPKFAWAYVNYQINGHWSVKGGRQRLPFYRYSDYLQVGAAYPWISPPISVYGVTAGDSNFDGVSASGLYDIGSWEFRPEAIYGGSTATTVTGSSTLTIIAKNIAGMTLDSTYEDWLSLRLSYLYFNSLTFSNPALDSLTQALAAEGNTVAATNFATDGDVATFAGAGFEINRYHFVLSGEYVDIRTLHTAIGSEREYYLSLGYHWNKWTPIATFGHQDEKSSNPGVLGEIPMNDPYYGVIAGFIDAQHAINDYYEVGARYDVSRNTALKVDFTRYLSGISGVPGANLLTAGFVFTF